MFQYVLYLLAVFVVTSHGSSISNGTCYWGPGQEADETYIPCGNTLFGNFACCQLGHKFNNYNTCVQEKDLITYVAGCTDPTYTDESCPYKGDFSSQQWVGLSWSGCTVPSDGIVPWIGCSNNGSAEVVNPAGSEKCVCNDKDEPLFVAPTGLVAEGWVPSSKMGEMTWIAGFGSSATVMMSSTGAASVITTLSPSISSSNQGTATTSTSSDTKSASSGLSTSTSAIATFAAASPSSPSNGNELSTASKAGIGIGIAAACAFAGLLIGYGLYRYRQKHREEKQTLHDLDDTTDHEKHAPSSGSEPAMLDAESTQRGSMVSGQKSELPGSPTHPLGVNSTSPSIASTMQNDDHVIFYKPFRYQTAELEGIAELPEKEGVKSQQQDLYEPYRAEHGLGLGDVHAVGGARVDRDGNVHALPG